MCAKEGARVGLVGRDEAPLAETAAMVGEGGLVLRADISVEAEVHAACDRLAEEWTRTDGVFANGGINGVWAPIEDLDLGDWERTIAINLRHLSDHQAHGAASEPPGRLRGDHLLVNGTRIFTNVGATAYSCSKAGQVAMAKMLALELAPRRIRVNVVCPGKISTDIEESTDKQDLEDLPKLAVYPQGNIPLTHGRAGRPLDVARAVVFLLSDAAAHISGTEMWIDGAESLLVG